MTWLTPRDVITQLGGIKAVMALTGSKYNTVFQWWSKNKTFPANTYEVMQSALQALGLHAHKSLWRQK